MVMAFGVTAMYETVNDHADNQCLDHRHGVIALKAQQFFRKQVSAYGCHCNKAEHTKSGVPAEYWLNHHPKHHAHAKAVDYNGHGQVTACMPMATSERGTIQHGV